MSNLNQLKKQQQQTNKQLQQQQQKQFFLKIMFNKHLSVVTMLSQTKPTRWIYVLHNLQGHSSVCQFLILKFWI